MNIDISVKMDAIKPSQLSRAEGNSPSKDTSSPSFNLPVEETDTTTATLGLTGRSRGDDMKDYQLMNLPPLRSVTPSTSIASLDGSRRHLRGSARGLIQRVEFPEEESRRGSVELANSKQAKSRVDLFTEESCLQSVDWILPKFGEDELMVGRYLGRGAFSVVEEIHGIRLCAADDNEKEEVLAAAKPPGLLRYGSVAEDNRESRKFIANHCTRPSGDARYAIKKLRPEVANDPEKSWGAVTDLLLETHFLRHFEHPHIIKLRATASCNPYSNGYFLVLDRLYATLSTRLLEWKKRHTETKSTLFRPFRRSEMCGLQCELLMERIRAAYHLSAALKYVHKRNVIHRDIKPENIGFDVRGDIKIFDFGLARELLDSDACGDGTYLLSNMTGSLRYMAPEVFVVDTPYNSKCDVHSFALLFWQILALKKPYQELRNEANLVSKVMFEEYRPPIKKKWPKACREILQNSWTADPKKRMSMDEVNAALRDEVARLWTVGKSDVLDTSRRRSTFVFRGLSDLTKDY